jgi:hypothetical protein
MVVMARRMVPSTTPIAVPTAMAVDEPEELGGGDGGVGRESEEGVSEGVVVNEMMLGVCIFVIFGLDMVVSSEVCVVDVGVSALVVSGDVVPCRDVSGVAVSGVTEVTSTRSSHTASGLALLKRLNKRNRVVGWTSGQFLDMSTSTERTRARHNSTVMC